MQALIQIVTLAGFWIACISDLQPHDLLLGIGAVALSVAFCLFTIGTLPLQFRPTLAEILPAIRIPWYVAIDLFLITFVLLRDLIGRRAPSLFRSVPWRHVENNGADTAKRVLAIAYTTVSPNCVVIGVDCERGQFLFHELHADSLPSYTRELGAEDPQ